MKAKDFRVILEGLKPKKMSAEDTIMGQLKSWMAKNPDIKVKRVLQSVNVTIFYE